MTLGFFGTLDLIQALVGGGVLLLYLLRAGSAPMERRQAVRWGIAWVLAATLLFWVAGPHSFAMRYSELDSLSLVKVPPLVPGAEKFLHNYAGGVDAWGIAVNTGQYLSLERLLFQSLPFWLAYAFHKIALYAVYMVGGYKLSRGFGAGRETALAAGGLASMGMGALNFVTITHGLAYGLAPLIAHLLVQRQGRRRYWLGVVAAGAVLSVSASFPHALLSVITATGVVGLLRGIGSALRVIPALAVVVGLFILNWHEAAYAMVALGPYSFRGVDISFASEDAAGFFTQLFRRFGEFREVTLLTLFGVAVLAWSRSPRAAWVAVLMALFLVGGPALVQVPWGRLGLGVLKGYNFHYLLFALPVVAAAVAGIADSVPRPGRRSLVAAVAVALLIGRFTWSQAYEISTWLSEGGQQIIAGNHNLIERGWSPELGTRTISVPYRLPMGAAAMAGLETFDGTLNMMTRAAALYWQKGINAPTAISGSGGHLTLWRLQQAEKCCVNYRLADYANLELLRAVNVGTVISRLPLTDAELTRLDGPADDAIPPRADTPLIPRLSGYLRLIRSPDPLYVYRLSDTLPRVWAASRVEVVATDASEDEVLARLSPLVRQRVAVLRAGQVANLPAGRAEVTGFTLVRDGFNIELRAPQGGIVMLNVPYLPFWQARADGVGLTVVSANGAQIAVMVPPGVTHLEARYERPLLRERLVALIH